MSDLAQHIAAVLLYVGATAATGACGSPSGAVEAGDRQALVVPKGNHVTNEQTPINQRFRTLEGYLRYLERDSHKDGKWYKEIRPGVYEVQTGNLHLDDDTQKRIFTREELARMFGFSE